jgi:putative ABC transport system permease protein
VIQPWIREVLTEKLPKGAIVVGSEIRVEEKGTVKFFGREYPVAATLEPIGNRLDQAVFVDIATLESIREAAQEKGVVFLLRNENPEKLAYSSILIKLAPNADLERLSREIHTRFDGLQVRGRKDMFSGLEKSARTLQIVVWVIVAFFLIVAVSAIVISFSLSTRERQREYALLRVVGYARNRLRLLVLGESLLVSAVGTYIGLLFASVAFFTFKIWIGEHVGIPFIVPDTFDIVRVYVVIILLLHSVGPVAVYGVANKVSKIDAYAALREVEH